MYHSKVTVSGGTGFELGFFGWQVGLFVSYVNEPSPGVIVLLEHCI